MTVNLELEAYARFQDPQLTEAEIRLLRAVPKGRIAVCGPDDNDANPENDAEHGEKWPRERRIRAELLRWLSTDRQVKELVDPQGLQVYGALIVDELDFSHVNVPFPLRFWHCRLLGKLKVSGAELSTLDLDGSWIHSLRAEGTNFRYEVCLGDGFGTDGEVVLTGARIQGTLTCDGGRFRNTTAAGTGETPKALKADGLTLGGDVSLGKGFESRSEVQLVAAQIGGDLVCHEAEFLGRLNAQRAVIKGIFVWIAVAKRDSTKLDLINASAGALYDDDSWPAQNNVRLDGFEYGRITSLDRDSHSRLEWLARQKPFSLQPYRKLAKILKDEGDDVGARRVL